jgi:DNA repair protein RadA/Sms
MSIWGGEPGVGKTKLAVAAGKKVNEVTNEAILYINGEDSEENFRMKVGNDANPDLFRVVTANMLPVQRVCDLAYEIKPRVIFIDSFQTLAEYHKGQSGQNTALTILRSLMGDVRAGMPHIVLISQLNKSGDLAGARILEHLADLVASVTKVDGRKGVFLFAVERKNRGGETPRSALFQHTDISVVCVSDSALRNAPIYKLAQPTTPAIEQGIVDIPIVRNEEDEESEE